MVDWPWVIMLRSHALGACLALLLLGPGPLTAAGATFKELDLRSRDTPLVLSSPGQKAQFLLDVRSTFLLKGKDEKEPNRLGYGTLVTVPTGQIITRMSRPLAVGSAVLDATQALAVVESFPRAGELVHVFRGRVVADSPWGRSIVEAGQSLLLASSSPGQASRLSAATTARLLSLVTAVDELSAGRGLSRPVPGLLEVSLEEGTDEPKISVTPLDPALGAASLVTRIAQVLGSKATRYIESSLKLPHDDDTTHLSFRCLPEGDFGTEVTMEFAKSSDPVGYTLVNRMSGGDFTQVCSLADRESLVVAPYAGSYSLSRKFSYANEPLTAIKLDLASGYGFLGREKQATDARGEKTPSLPTQAVDIQLAAPEQGGVRLDELLLLTRPDALKSLTAPERVMADAQRVLELDVPADAVLPSDPAELMRAQALRVESKTSSRRTLSVVQVLPLTVTDLLTYLPIQTKAIREGTDLELVVMRPRRASGDELADRILHQVQLGEPTRRPPVIEVTRRTLYQPPPSVFMGLAVLFQSDSPLPQVDKILERGNINFKDKGKVDYGELDWVVDIAQITAIVALALLTIALILGFHKSRFFKSFFPDKVKCPYCGRPMEQHVLMRGDPDQCIEVFEGLAVFEASPGFEEAEKLRRKMLPHRKSPPPPDTEIVFDIEAYWCFRCAEGLVLTRLKRRELVLDEAQIPFRGAEVLEALTPKEAVTADG